MYMPLEKYTRANYDSYEDFCQNFSMDCPSDFNFAYDVMDELAEKRPDDLALLWCDVSGREERFTFAQLKFYSDKAAAFLQQQGIQAGDRVMLMLKRRYQYWFVILGLCKLHAIAVPATHLLTPKDIQYRVEMGRLKMLIAVGEPRVKEAVQAAKALPGMENLKVVLQGDEAHSEIDLDEGIEAAPVAFDKPQQNNPLDPMLIFFTSGTTGMPKMVAHDFYYALGHIVTARFWHRLEPGDIHLTLSDTGWGKSSWGKLYGQWLCGCTVFVYDFERFVAKELLAIMAKYQITSFCAPPTVQRYLVKEGIEKYGLHSLKKATVAGEALSTEVYNEFLAQTGVPLLEGFGQTETSLQLFTPEWITPRPGSMGKPSPLFDVCLLDEEDKPVGPGNEGEIAIRCQRDKRPPSMFMGYLDDEPLTQGAWHDGYYHSGDIAWMDEDGYYWFVSRKDDVIKSSGYRIGPFEVESALMSHPSVLECAITAVPDLERGQVVKATIVLMDGYQGSPELKKELQTHVKSVTAPYKYPRIIDFVPELPKTISGKIRRAELREKDSKKDD